MTTGMYGHDAPHSLNTERYAMHTVSMTINGKELTLETVRFAKLAAGSVMVRY